MASMAKADKFYGDARKKANKFDWFGMSKQNNQEDAADLFNKAATQYKIAKEYKKAGDAYKEGAQCQMAAGNQIEAKQLWRDAGKMYRHVSAELAIDAYNEAIQLNLDGDRFAQAARLQEEIADMLADDDHTKEAIAAYEKCAEFFNTENDTTNANKRLLKVAHLCPKTQNYERAIEIFEKIAKDSVDNNLLRWKVKEYLYKSLLCQLCAGAADDIKNWRKLEQIADRYKDISDIYATSREAKFLDSVIESISNLDIDSFKDANVEFEKISRIEPWAVDLLLNLEHYITEQQHAAPDLDSGFGDNDEKKDDTGINSGNNNSTDNPVDNTKTGGAAPSNPFSQGDHSADPDAPDLDDL